MTSTHPNFYARWGKRCLDIAVASSALVAFAPVMVAVAAALHVRMGSPVLFRQRRPGRGTAPFTILKFRTMNDARDARGELLPDNHRLTALGKFLRKTSLDELPQLLNVVRGDMSLVGPRPLLERYLPWYTDREATRHDARPGITGLAQVSGRNEIEWDTRLELDASYVEDITLLGDLQIVARTVAKVLGRADVRVDTSTMVALDDERAAAQRRAA